MKKWFPVAAVVAAALVGSLGDPGPAEGQPMSVAAAHAQPSASATADAACADLVARKPAVPPAARADGGALVVRMPASTVRCDRVLRVLDRTGGPRVVPVPASTRSVRLSARPGAVLSVQYKVVTAEAESPWSELSAPVAVSGAAASLSGLAATSSRGGVVVSWTASGDPASIAARYRLHVSCGGVLLLRAAVDAAVTSLWVPAAAPRRCDVDVTAVGVDGAAGTTARVQLG